MQRDSIAAVARQSLEFDELSEQIMEEAIIDEAVWFSVIGGAFTSKANAARIIRQNRWSYFADNHILHRLIWIAEAGLLKKA